MEPITFILTAVTLGVAAGLKPTAEQAIKDAYTGLKTLIQDRYEVNLSGLEKKPKSKAQITAVEESLKDVEADKDAELLNKAKELLDTIKRYDADIATTKAIDFDNIEAGYVKVKKILAEGTSEAVRMKGVKVKDGIEVEDVTAVSDPKVQRQ